MLESLAKSWLTLQCQMLPNVQRGLVVLGSAAGETLIPTAAWPDSSSVTDAMAATARLAAARRSAVVRSSDHDGGQQTQVLSIACPLLLDGQQFGVVAVEAASSSEQQRAVMQLLKWGSSWLEFLVQRESSAVSRRLLTLIEVVATALNHDRFQPAATATATELSRRLSCERVSIGFVEGKRSRVRAVSDTVRWQAKSNLIRSIEACMDEAVDQKASIVFPTHPGLVPRVVQAHERLAASVGSGAVCSVPLIDQRDAVGVITFERGEDQPFDTSTVELCEAVGALMAPILDMKCRDDRWLGAKALDSARKAVQKIFGPRHWRLKLVVLALIGTGVFSSMATGPHRVTSSAVIESLEQQAIVAPQAGYVASADVRAGQVVSKGQRLASLDDKDLTLERLKLSSHLGQLTKEHRQALASRDRSRTRILKSKIHQAQAQLALAEEQLARLALTAPFDGVIVSGDLSQAKGAPVDKGELLFEIAAIDAHRVILQVDEREISNLGVGLTGVLALSARPDARLPLTVTLITPVSTAEDGRNYFRVEATLARHDAGLRPGMKGVAKLDVGERKLVWIWSHQLMDWLRLKLWAWWP